MDWADDGLSVFKKRRDYDFCAYLPEFTNKNAGQRHARVKRNFLMTVSDMMLDGFFKTATKCANSHHSKLTCESIDHPAPA